jgi:hypothetical protein
VCFGTNIHFHKCSPQIDISNDVSCASNGDSMPKLRPREIDVPIYPNGAHILAFHLLGLGFWMFRVFHCFSIIYRPSSLIVTQSSEASSRPHLFSEINYQRPSYFISILSVSIFQSFVVNEMEFYFLRIFAFMCISVFHCVPA